MQKDTKIQLPEKVTYIIDTIMTAGYEAYAVGGCIRDCILGREPNDFDITTSASPLQVKALFPRTVDTGLKHGTVTVLLEKECFEVTTYRIDGKYEDGRHPREVIFTASLQEDLKRRDFTINAMAYNEKDGLVDIFGGVEDIKEGIIRCVGNPKERFSEDALRIMRAVRFSAQFGYTIERNTKEAIEQLAFTLQRISAERIMTELVKLVTSPHPDHLMLAYETGITAVILPEFDSCMKTEQKNPHHCYNVGRHTIETMKAVRADKVLRLGALFHDMGKPACISEDEDGIYHFHGHAAVSEKIAGTALRRLKFDNDTIYAVKALVKYHDLDITATEKGVRRAIMKTGEEIFPLLLELKKADMMAQSDYRREEKEKHLADIQEAYQKVLLQKQCVSLKTLAINGKDLIEQVGMKPGKELGDVLKSLLEKVIEEPSLNDRNYLLKEAKELIKR